MAALYGRLRGSRGEVTRTGTAKSNIEAVLETWTGKVRVTLMADGKFCVETAPKHSNWYQREMWGEVPNG